MNNSRPKIYIRRNLESEIIKYIDDPEIIAVLGPRQCGKTTLFQHISSNLSNVNFVSFEDIRVLNLFESDIESFIEQHVKGFDYLFIDEFQYSKEGKKLKYIYDKYDTKILITGSSSVELSFNGIKYLTGRVLIFKLYPLSFKEYLSYKSPRLLDSNLSKPVISQILPFFDEYVIYGGYPRVVTEDERTKKKKILQNIYNIYMLREIKEILNIKDSERLQKLIKALSLQIAGLITYSELSNISGFQYDELKDHLSILEDTFVLQRIRPFYTNKRTELVKNPKVFFYDNGFRNAVIDNFSTERADIGELYENFVFSELIKRDKVRYWRSKSKAEVDFIFRKMPIEVKTNIAKTKLTKSFISYLKKYKPKKGYMLSYDFTGKRKYMDTQVEYMPIFNLGLKDL